MQKIILHCDLNNFFASATLAINPTLKTLPVAICGDAKKRHGIVLAKNSVAKKYGVLTAETIWAAQRKCPELIIVSPDYERYEAISLKVQHLYLEYSDRVEPFGIDECWVDITNPSMTFKKAEKIANEIRCRVKRDFGVTVSIGVSFTKSLAKLGSDMKKPDAVTVIDRKFFETVVWNMPCKELLMAGRSACELLRTMGIFTIGDLAKSDEVAVRDKLGKNGCALRTVARGEDCSEVLSYYHREKPKSIGHSATAEKDLTEKEEVFAAILGFSEGICYKLRRESLLASSVVLHTLTADFEGKEYKALLPSPTDLSMTIAKAAMEIFEKNNCLNTPLRAVGVRVVDLKERTEAIQLNLLDDYNRVLEENLEKEILVIRSRYGNNSLKRAICIDNKAVPSSPGFYKKQ